MNRSTPTLAWLLLLIVVAVVLPIVGCTSTRERFIQAGYHPADADGYEDGHSSGYHVARGRLLQTKKDSYRYDSDTEYRRGWDDGYAVSTRDFDPRR